MAPVAVCTLATFFEDLDVFKAAKTNEEIKTRNPDPIHRFNELRIPTTSCSIARACAQKWLYQRFGCLAGALAYLHSENIKIKHKDLKPSNFLLTQSGIWIADFGTSTDFSYSPESETDNGERGTARYFAPEVANWAGTRRAADVFSLGCIFLEMFCSCTLSEPLKDVLLSLFPVMDQSGAYFQANIDHIHNRLVPSVLASTRGRAQQHLLLEIKQMLSRDPKERPTAAEVKKGLGPPDGTRRTNSDDWKEWSFHGTCCPPGQVKRRRPREGDQQVRLQSTTASTTTGKNSPPIPMTNPSDRVASQTRTADSSGDFNQSVPSNMASETEQQFDGVDSDDDEEQRFAGVADLRPEVEYSENRPVPRMRTNQFFYVGIDRSASKVRPTTSSASPAPQGLTSTTSPPNRSSTSTPRFPLSENPYPGSPSLLTRSDNIPMVTHGSPTDLLTPSRANSILDTNPFRRR